MVLELSYGMQAAKWLTIRPDIQYIFHQGTFKYKHTRVCRICRFPITPQKVALIATTGDVTGVAGVHNALAIDFLHQQL